jgi:hypothetical protein
MNFFAISGSTATLSYFAAIKVGGIAGNGPESSSCSLCCMTIDRNLD